MSDRFDGFDYVMICVCARMLVMFFWLIDLPFCYDDGRWPRNAIRIENAHTEWVTHNMQKEAFVNRREKGEKKREEIHRLA